jgi:hypothetical protein
MSLYEVAYFLKLPVSYIENEMSNKELSGWFEYFQRRPPGWQEDQRTAMVVNAFGAKKKPEELFPSLKSMRRAEERANAGNSRRLSVAQQFMMKFGDRFPQLKLEK